MSDKGPPLPIATPVEAAAVPGLATATATTAPAPAFVFGSSAEAKEEISAGAEVSAVADLIERIGGPEEQEARIEMLTNKLKACVTAEDFGE